MSEPEIYRDVKLNGFEGYFMGETKGYMKRYLLLFPDEYLSLSKEVKAKNVKSWEIGWTQAYTADFVGWLIVVILAGKPITFISKKKGLIIKPPKR